MIQRIQSIYLLIAVIVSIVCLCMQIGTLTLVAGGDVAGRVYNLWTVNTAMGDHVCNTWPLFVILVFSAAIGLFTIFMYRNRRVQARFCMFNSLLIVGWYILFAVLAHVLVLDGQSFSPSVASVLPVVSLIGYILARRSIMADERLVRAADRIR